MSDDELFRLILLAGFVIFMPIGIYHRLKARTGEKLDRRQEGLFIMIAVRLVGIAGIAGLIAYLINPACMAWAAVPLPVWLRWTGVGLALIAGLLLVWMFRTLGRNLTDTVVTRQQHTLVTTGPYRWVRHPFYSASLWSNEPVAGSTTESTEVHREGALNP
jgi:protein-S-isoprenylcysteine O-methyltransferase Ste14